MDSLMFARYERARSRQLDSRSSKASIIRNAGQSFKEGDRFSKGSGVN